MDIRRSNGSRSRRFDWEPIPVPLRVYEDLDPELEVLGTWLRGKVKQKPQDHFEQAIGRLLLLAGWQVDVLQESA